MQVFLGFGSNLGDRSQNIARGIDLLAGAGLRSIRVSPAIETPALLPDDAPSHWNVPYLNLVIEAEADEDAHTWLPRIKRIQDTVGKRDGSRWSPRALDIDILLWGETRIADEQLNVPHAQLADRGFVLVPLAHLAPRLAHALLDGTTPLARARTLEHRLPLWMGIVNLTPDSFSADGRFASVDAVLTHAQALANDGAQILDFGAESTRPGATPLDADTEWRRLEPALRATLDAFAGQHVRPRISVDTYHASVAERALTLGVDMINDVGGLGDADMQQLARAGGEWVAMHNLGVPASADRLLAVGCDAVAEVSAWLEARIERWQVAGIDLNRVLFDPGIGFGKSSLQSLDLMRGLRHFHRFGLRLLVGHSRKSFMRAFSGPASSRDIETVGASLKLCDNGADILRVHDVAMHVRAYTTWSHLQGYD